jgi:biotin carboxylase
MVLGGSVYQRQVLEAARRRGYRVLVLDMYPDPPLRAEADLFIQCSTADVDGALGHARRHRVSGVIAAATDVAVYTQAVIAAELGLNGPPADAARILTDKAAFRRDEQRAGRRIAQWVEIASGHAAAPTMPSPKAVLKPNRSSGSKGAFIVSSQAELEARLPECLEAAGAHGATLEAFIEGRQMTVEGFRAHGKMALALITDRDTAPSPYVATVGHRTPTTLDPAGQAAVLDALNALFDRHGVRTGPFDADLVVTPDGEAVVLEATPRLGGNSLTRLVASAVGVDIADWAVGWAVGDLSQPERHAERRSPVAVDTPSAVRVLGSASAGALAYDGAQADQLRSEDWVRHLSFDVPPGAPVEPFRHGRARVGEALLTAPSRTALDARIAEFDQRLALTAKPAEVAR